MNEESKKQLFEKAKEIVLSKQQSIIQRISKLRQLIETKVSSAKLEDSWTNASVKALNEYSLKQLEILKESPFFNKIETEFNGNKKTIYIGKSSFPEENIFSWVSPIASIRFDNPGPSSYTLPSGEKREGIVYLKDNYQISQGEILFYSTESINSPRELIYQKNFSRKDGFILPEIVSQMEKAQDTIIRAHYKGPFVISGPAGSGKTTLALHRIAYLLQAPHTSELYKDQSIIVFVQDQNSKDYFSHILPELGITTVRITTFIEWAAEILSIPVDRIKSSYSNDLYFEFQKIKAFRKRLQKGSLLLIHKHFSQLDDVYQNELSIENSKLFLQQKKDVIFDRIDLTVLLMAYKEKFKKLHTIRESHSFDTKGNLVRKKKKVYLDYGIVLVDEFQNYIPEQISLFTGCLNKDLDSIIYAGDVRQQINPGTTNNEALVYNDLYANRNIHLQKVYRNTQKIIHYISSLGYTITTPETIKEGSDVIEKKVDTESELVEYVQNVIQNNREKESLGIIAIDPQSLSLFKQKIEINDYIHIMSARESQGLEFDTVCIVDFNKLSYFENYKKTAPEFQEEKKKIDRDILYIALTRAISRLHIIYTE